MPKWRSLLVLLALFSFDLASQAQNNCGSTPPTGICPAAAPPVQVWCAGNNPSSLCPGGTYWIGFDTTTPGVGSWSGQFEGLDAATLLTAGRVPRPQADPNGAVGPTDSTGVGQYLEFADNYVQAFDRSTGNPIFTTHIGDTPSPQPLSTLFAPGAKTYCANPSFDGTATYDRIDNVFVVSNLFNPAEAGTFYFCIGVSAASNSVPASNLEGSNSQGHWNVYAYEINPALPGNSRGVYYPDYPRFGIWSDGFYVAWDLLDINNKSDIVGFEVCQFDKADILAGQTTNPPACYSYIPKYAGGAGGTDISLIHTLLPADFEGDTPIPANTSGEYFLALVNPSNPGTNNQCTQLPCKSNQLAFWTWKGFTTGAGPTLLTVPTAYTPGCYNPKYPYVTYCVPEPYGGFIDGLGDRLMTRLAYRFILGSKSEILAVTHTVKESATNRTGIRYYKIRAAKKPSIIYAGDIQDTKNLNFLSMPSVAIDGGGNLGVTYTATGSISYGSVQDYDPSPFFATVNNKGVRGAQVPILSTTGLSGQDETDQYWGEYVSVSTDPDDDLTFWVANQYMLGDQITNCNFSVGSGCTWATRIYTCKHGSGC